MIGLGLSLRKGGTASGDIFDIFVDSVGGDDLNSGTKRSEPLQTLTAALAAAPSSRARIGLKRGSFWRESLDLSTITSPRVGAYGTGNPPRISGTDVFSSWSKTAGRTNVYQTSVTYESGGRITVYEDDILLERVADEATCDSTPGSFVKLLANTAGTSTLKIHASDSGNPSSNGKIYEVSVRRNGIYGVDNTIVSGIQTEKAISNNGSTDLVNRTNCIVSKILAANGTKHNLGIGAGFAEDCIVYLADDVTSEEPSSNPFVAFVNDGTGLTARFTRCGVIGPAPGNDFTAHGNPTSFDSVSLEQCWTLTQGVASSMSVNVGCYVKSVANIPCLFGSTSMLGAFIDNADAGTATPGQYSEVLVENTVASVKQKSVATQFQEVFRVNGSYPAVFNNCSFYCDTSLASGPATIWWANGDSNQDITLTNSIIFNGAQLMILASGGSYVGDYNVFLAGQPGETRDVSFNHYSAGYLDTLAGWQAATSQDLNSVYLKRADQTRGSSTAFWLCVANDEANSPHETGDYRVNPNAKVYGGDGTAHIGTFPDGTLITTVGAQKHWNWNTRAEENGPQTMWPQPPSTLEESKTYILSPEGWNFYPN